MYVVPKMKIQMKDCIPIFFFKKKVTFHFFMFHKQCQRHTKQWKFSFFEKNSPIYLAPFSITSLILLTGYNQGLIFRQSILQDTLFFLKKRKKESFTEITYVSYCGCLMPGSPFIGPPSGVGVLLSHFPKYSFASGDFPGVRSSGYDSGRDISS